MTRAVSRKLKNQPVGSVVVQRQGDRTFLVVQETPDRVSLIESWDDAFALVGRLLGRIGVTLNEMNAELSAFNRRSTANLRKTKAKIAANQRLLEKLVKARP